MTDIRGRIPADIEPASEAGQVIPLSFVRDEHVPKAHRDLVARHVRRIRRRYKLPPIAVRYFGPAVAGDEQITFTALEAGAMPLGVALWRHHGGSTEEAIALHHGLRGEHYVVRLIAHEVR